MRSRVMATLVVVCLTGFLAGCGDDSEGASGGNSTKELESTPASGDSGSGSGSDSGSSDTTDMSIPDLHDLEDLAGGSIPDFGDLGDCMQQATAYASLAMSALGGDDSGKSAENALKEMKSSLPDDLKDDIEVLADAYKKVAKDGFIKGGEAMDTPEFQKADDPISAYFEETCGG